VVEACLVSLVALVTDGCVCFLSFLSVSERRNQVLACQYAFAVLLRHVATVHTTIPSIALHILALCMHSSANAVETIATSPHMKNLIIPLSHVSWEKHVPSMHAVRDSLMILSSVALGAQQYTNIICDLGVVPFLINVLRKCVARNNDGTMCCNGSIDVMKITELTTVILHICSAVILRLVGHTILQCRSKPESSVPTLVQVLLSLILECESEQVRFSSIGTLAAWCIDTEILAEVRNANGLSVFVRTFINAQNRRIQLHTAFALINCSLDAESRAFFQETNIIPALINVIDSTTADKQIRLASAAVLRNLMQSPDMCESLFYVNHQTAPSVTNGLEILVECVRASTTNMQLAVAVAEILINVARFGSLSVKRAVLASWPLSSLEQYVRGVGGELLQTAALMLFLNLISDSFGVIRSVTLLYKLML